MNRRQFAFTGAIALAGTAWAPALNTTAPTDFASFDREIEAFMKPRGIPGGAVAVVKNGRLVYSRGYGWADRENKAQAKPDTLFRIASISKPITGVAVMKLIEQGKVSLDTKVFPLLGIQPAVMSFTDPEPRLRDITVQQLLQHTGGWDRDRGFDPMFRPVRIAKANGVPPPASAREVIRYMLSRPLDFAPGTRYAYSNFGYNVLGRLVEKVSGLSYETYVRKNILEPAGIKRMRIGASLDGKQAKGEARYYTAGETHAESVFEEGKKVPEPYGSFHLEAMDAHGGWIASALDLVRFAAALEPANPKCLLKPETLRAMYALPPEPVWRKPDGTPEDSHYGCGWAVRPTKGDKANYWHAGSLPGTYSLLVRRWDGLTWAVIFNQRSADAKLPDEAIDPALHRAAAAVAKWPEGEAL